MSKQGQILGQVQAFLMTEIPDEIPVHLTLCHGAEPESLVLLIHDGGGHRGALVFRPAAAAHFLGSLLIDNAEPPREVKTMADALELAAAFTKPKN